MKKISTRLLVMLTVLLAQVSTVLAAPTISVSSLDIKAGQQKDVTVSIETDQADIYQIQATVSLPKGLKLVAVGGDYAQPAALTQGFIADINDAGTLLVSNLNMQPISAKKGAIVTFRVKADETLAESSSITLTGIRVWHIGGTSENLASASAQVNMVDGSAEFQFGQTMVNLGAGSTATVSVLMNNEASISGFEATLILPAGVTAKVAKASRLASAPTYTASTGKIVYFAGSAISGNQGALFTITLTADNSFKENAVVTLSDIILTTPKSKEIYAEDITLQLIAKDEAAYEAALSLIDDLKRKMRAAEDEIANDYPAAVYDLEDEADDIWRDINILGQGIEDGYENNDLDLAEIQEIAGAISEDIDELLAKAKALQEVAELQEKLDDAVELIPSDLPKAATKELSDDIDAIQAQIDDLKDAAEVYGTVDAAKKQKVLDDIAALIAKIKTWLRGDVAQNQVVEMPDFYALADSILKENLPTDLASNAFYRFDANADQELNVGDMQGIVNIVLGMDAYGNAARQAEAIEASLSVETMKIGNITRYTLNLTGMEYTAFQMDVNGRVVAENADGVSLRSADLKNGSHRVLGIGTKNDGTVLCIDVEGQAQFSNIVFTTANAQTVKFNLGTTGIASVKAAAENGQAYDLNGRAVKNAKGVVIVDGKKVIR